MTEILLNGINVDELLIKIGQLLDEKLLSTSESSTQPKFISRKEVAILLKISLPTLNEWTKLGWIQSYKMGNRVLYKLDEVEQSIEKLATYKNKKINNLN